MPTPNLATRSSMLLLSQVQGINQSLPKWDLFLREVNDSIDALNKSIELYNSTPDLEDKKTILRGIYEGYKQIVKKHPDNYIKESEGYKNEIHHKLFYQLKEQFSQFGVDSLYDNAVYERQRAPTHSPVEIFANMTPEKIADVLAIFSSPAPLSFQLLAKLYSPTDSEYAAFQAFLSAYDISILGGNNSKNYKITPTPARKTLTGEEPCVLKIEYRMGMPKFLETEIRDKISPSRLTPLMLERQGTIHDPIDGDFVTKTLVITDFCSGGDLMHHAALQSLPVDKIQSALTIYKQMAEILIQLQNNNSAFIDMKNTNWLIDEKGVIQISDTKGFFPTRSDGILDRDSYESRWFGFVSTKYMNPPEFTNSRSFDVDKAHAYMLGKNLYHYLTEAKLKHLEGHDASAYNFMHPVFTSSLLGERMKKLITDLVKPMTQPYPAKRKSVAYALETLKKIELSLNEILDLKTECHRVLNEIKTLDLNSSTSAGQAMYQNVEFEIKNQIDRDDLINLKAVFDAKLTKVKVAVIKTDCRDLWKQIDNFNFSFINSTYHQYLEEKKSLIQTENDPGILIKIKEELVECLGQIQQIQKLRDGNNEIINKIRAYGFRGHDALEEFLVLRESALALGEMNFSALVQMKNELTTALMKATIAFDLKSECHSLIDEITKLGNLTDDPELQVDSIKKHAKVDCIFDINQLKQYKVGLEELGAVDNSSVEARRPAACPRDPEMLMNMQVYCTEIDRTGSREQVAGRRNINCQQPLLMQEKDILLMDEVQEPTAPSPGSSK